MTFEIAKKVAYAASELDWLKKLTSHVLAAEAEVHINILHECAMELAGARACEIYSDPYELYPVQKGGNAGAPANESSTLAKVIDFCGQRKCDKPEGA